MLDSQNTNIKKHKIYVRLLEYKELGFEKLIHLCTYTHIYNLCIIQQAYYIRGQGSSFLKWIIYKKYFKVKAFLTCASIS